MKCARTRDLFSSYLENEMDTSTCAAFEQHLSECAKCKADYDRFTAAVMMLDEVPEVDPPAYFRQTVMARVRESRTPVAEPARWWRQIDWQYVFTLRVPARAAAVAVAALLMVAVIVQTTPVGTGVMNLLGLQRIFHKSIGVDTDNLAPPWSPFSRNAAYDMSGSGLLISVSSEPAVSGRTYALRLQTKVRWAIKLAVQAGGKNYDGSVAQDQDSIIHVPVVQPNDAVTARVTWVYRGVRHIQYVFLPRKFDPRAYQKRLDLTFECRTVNDVLQTISRNYGVVILASGDLGQKVTYAEVRSGNPTEALFHGVEETANMKQEALGPSIYIVEPVK